MPSFCSMLLKLLVESVNTIDESGAPFIANFIYRLHYKKFFNDDTLLFVCLTKRSLTAKGLVAFKIEGVILGDIEVQLKWFHISSKMIVALSCAVFLIVGIFSLAKNGVHYDDAFNASVAKNFASGHGYSTSYDVIAVFNPLITTGPTLILPAALGVKVLGNKYWVPGLCVLAINLILLVLILNILLNEFKFEHWRVFIFVISLLAFNYEFTNSGEVYQMRLFASLMGEGTAFLLFILGVLNITKKEGNNSNKLIIITGFILGLSFLTKNILLLPILGVIFFIYSKKGFILKHFILF